MNRLAFVFLLLKANSVIIEPETTIESGTEIIISDQ
jgi:hypothetical protein